MNYYQNYGGYQMPQVQQLNGCIVDCADTVRGQNIPIGSYGIFPQADQSAIYMKTWNVDGTTKVVTYLPQIVKEEPKSDRLEDIYKAISDLSTKIDNIKPNNNGGHK